MTLPNPNVPKPAELVWRGEIVLVVRDGRFWAILQGRRRRSGPAFIPGELWSSTQDRLREWLDLEAGPERPA